MEQNRFDYSEFGLNFQVTLSCNVSTDVWNKIKTAPKWLEWVRKIAQDESRVMQGDPQKTTFLRINGINITDVNMFGPNNVGFVKFTADTTLMRRNENGTVSPVINPRDNKEIKPPGIVFMRGGAVAILVVITAAETGERYTITTIQPRVPIGETETEEIPAGMIDEQTGNPTGAAITELREEVGLEIQGNQLIDLTANGKEMLPSPGGSDERIHLYAYEVTMPRSQIASMVGEMSKYQTAHEWIHTNIITFNEIPIRLRDSKALSAYALYNSLKTKTKPKTKTKT